MKVADCNITVFTLIKIWMIIPLVIAIITQGRETEGKKKINKKKKKIMKRKKKKKKHDGVLGNEKVLDGGK